MAVDLPSGSAAGRIGRCASLAGGLGELSRAVERHQVVAITLPARGGTAGNQPVLEIRGRNTASGGTKCLVKTREYLVKVVNRLSLYELGDSDRKIALETEYGE